MTVLLTQYLGTCRYLRFSTIMLLRKVPSVGLHPRTSYGSRARTLLPKVVHYTSTVTSTSFGPSGSLITTSPKQKAFASLQRQALAIST